MTVTIWPVEGLPEIREGDDLGALIAGRAELQNGDVLVVAQKAVSKAEGRIVRLAEIEASAEAWELAADHDPRQLEVMTAVILNVNKEFGVHAGLRLTGLP